MTKPFTKELSGSIRSNIRIINNIEGSDSTLMSSMSPSNSTEQGLTQASVGAGINYLGKSGFLSGNRLAIEYNLPIYTNTNSTQLITESTLILGIQRVL